MESHRLQNSFKNNDRQIWGTFFYFDKILTLTELQPTVKKKKDRAAILFHPDPLTAFEKYIFYRLRNWQ